MTDSHALPMGVLLLSPESAVRKRLRRLLENDGHAVLVVSTIGDAVARLRTRHYPLVLCANQQHAGSLTEDYALLLDSRGLLARSPAYELHLPGIGIDARAVLLVPVQDVERVPTIVRQVADRLGLQSQVMA